MKRKFWPWLASAAAVVVIIAGSLIFKQHRTTINLDKFSDHMLSSSLYYQGMEGFAGDNAGIAARYGIDGADVADARGFAAADGTSREFAIIKAVSVEKAGDMMTSFGLYAKDLMDGYSAAGNAEEYQRVRGYVISRTGEYVIFTISDSIGSGSLAAKTYLDSTIYDQTR
ncbi:MAG: DUF4358 domain-containing protein [Christensenellales bacterium]|jgi:hypothetical protein